MMQATMKRMRRFGVSVALLAGVAAVSPAALGEGAVDAKSEAVLKAASEYYASLKRVSFTVTAEQNVTAAGRSQSLKVGFDFAAERPNKFLMKPALADQPIHAVIVSDGKTLTHLVPEMNRYSESAAPATLDDIIETQEFMVMSGGIGQFLTPVLGSDPYAMFTEGSDGYTYEGAKEHEGKTYDVVRAESAPRSVDYWFTQGEKPVLARIVPDLSATVAAQRAQLGADFDASIVFTLSGFEGDGKLGADVFAAAIPQGTEKVESILGGAGQPQSIAVGTEAPAFELEKLGGEKMSLASHRGKDVVILDFWATWCGPCRMAMPVVDGVAEAFKGKHVVLYAVNLQESDDDVKAFLTDQKLNVSVLMDRAGAVGAAYGAAAIPMTVIIDKEGKVAKVHTGYSSGLKRQLTRELTALTKEVN